MTQAIRSRIRAGLERAGTRTAGAPLEATIRRSESADETVYPPVPGGSTDYAAVAVISEFSTDERNGMDIRSEDIKVLLSRPLVDSAGSETEPMVSDELSLAGEDYQVVDVSALRPGGQVLMWTVQARASSGR